MKRILLIEDTLSLAEEIADILRLEGYVVTNARNGAEGLNLLLKEKTDIIITDLLMPGMDGFEFIRKVRSMSEFNSIPLIILSAKTSEEDKEKGKALGANAFVGKPCNIEELLAAVRALTK